MLSLVLIAASLPEFTVFAITGETVCGDWKYKLVDDTRKDDLIAITAYTGQEDEIVIPSELDGHPVVQLGTYLYSSYSNTLKYNIFKELGDNYPKKITLSDGIKAVGVKAFYQLEGIEVYLPSSVQFIAINAFKSCKLKSLDLGDGLVGIAEYAFEYAEFEDGALTFPDSLKYVGKNAFGNSNITSVSFGKDVKFSRPMCYFDFGVMDNVHYRYNDSPFYDNKSLETINIDKDNPYIVNKNGIIYSSDMKTLYYSEREIGDAVIPDTVDTICDYALSYSEIGDLTVSANIEELPANIFTASSINKLSFSSPSRLKEIKSKAFENLTINEITIPKSVETIGDNAFLNSTLSSVTFEEDSMLLSIGISAFENTDIESLDLTKCSALSTIGEAAFFKCEILKSVDMTDVPIGIIDRSTFSHCSQIDSLKLSKFTYSVGVNAFYNVNPTTFSGYDYVMTKGTGNDFIPTEGKYNSDYIISTGTYGDFEYAEYENEIKITKCTSNEEELIFPDEINSKPVTVLGRGLFYSKPQVQKSYKRIKLPSNLKMIQNSAITNCETETLDPLPDTLEYIGRAGMARLNFTNDLVIPDSVWFIGDYAIETIQSQNVDFGNGVEYIGKNTLADSPNVTEYIIPDSAKYSGLVAKKTIKKIRYGANIADVYNRIINRKSNKIITDTIEVSENNKWFSTVDGVLFNKDKTVLLFYSEKLQNKSYSIPSGCARIKESAFYGNQTLKEVFIPNTMKVIGDYAFKNSFIEKVTFEDGFKTDVIGEAFSYCPHLKRVIFGENTEIKALVKTFYFSGQLEHINIPDSVECIEGAFYCCSSLSDYLNDPITLPKNLKYLGDSSFYQVKKCFKNLVISDNVERIGDSVFSGNTKIETVELGKNIKTLGSAVFYECKNLEYIDLTGIKFVDSYYNGTFKGCNKLKQVFFSNEEKQGEIQSDLLNGDDTVENVIIGKTVTEIKDGAFSNCSKLGDVYVSEEVEAISDSAFTDSENVVIVSTEGAPAIEYAKRLGIRYRTIQSFVVSPIPDQTYTGKAIKPKITVTQNNAVLRQNEDYSVIYSNNVNIGIASAKVVGVGVYRVFGTIAYFNIVAKGEEPDNSSPGNDKAPGKTLKLKTPKIKKVKRGKKKFKLYWQRVKGISFYQLQYSERNDFKKKKTVKISKKAKAKKIKKLKKNKRYYVRIRSAKKSNGKIIYSKWSKTVKVKTK